MYQEGVEEWRTESYEIDVIQAIFVRVIPNVKGFPDLVGHKDARDREDGEEEGEKHDDHGEELAL